MQSGFRTRPCNDALHAAQQPSSYLAVPFPDITSNRSGYRIRLAVGQPKTSKTALPFVHLAEANLQFQCLANAVLFSARAKGGDFRGADLTAAHADAGYFRGADFTSATLCGTRLRSADLRRAVLCGVDLTGASLEGADLTEATYDAATLWPAGVAPQSRGARMVRQA